MKWRATLAIARAHFACPVMPFVTVLLCAFFVSSNVGPRDQSKESKAHDMRIALRKQNRSVYEIAEGNLSMRAWTTFAYSRWSVAAYGSATVLR